MIPRDAGLSAVAPTIVHPKVHPNRKVIMGYSWAGLTKTRLAKEARDMANPAVVAGIHARMEENELEAKRIEQSGDRYAEKRAARWRENNIAPDAAFLAKYGHETK